MIPWYTLFLSALIREHSVVVGYSTMLEFRDSCTREGGLEVIYVCSDCYADDCMTILLLYASVHVYLLQLYPFGTHFIPCLLLYTYYAL